LAFESVNKSQRDEVASAACSTRVDAGHGEWAVGEWWRGNL